MSLALDTQSALVSNNDKQGVARNFNMNMLNNVLNKPNVQNSINSINKDSIQNAINSINNIVNPTRRPVINQQTLPNPAANNDILMNWIILNVNFVLNNTDGLGDFEKGLIADILPAILKSESLEQVLKRVEPFVVAGIASVLKDQSLFFSEDPLRDSVKSLLKKYFESPEAPAFLKDKETQDAILKFVSELLDQKDFDSLVNVISGEAGFLTQGAVQEVKTLIQQILPDLYESIKYETDVMIIYQRVYSYVVTNGIQYFNQIIGLLGSNGFDINKIVEMLQQFAKQQQN